MSKPLKVLIQDDSSVCRKIHQRLWEEVGYRPTLCETGASVVIEYLNNVALIDAGHDTQMFDIIMLNLLSPTSSCQTTGHLRKLGFAGQIIGVTGLAPRGLIDLRGQGANFALAKPFRRYHLNLILRDFSSGEKKQSKLVPRKVVNLANQTTSTEYFRTNVYSENFQMKSLRILTLGNERAFNAIATGTLHSVTHAKSALAAAHMIEQTMTAEQCGMAYTVYNMILLTSLDDEFEPVTLQRLRSCGFRGIIFGIVEKSDERGKRLFLKHGANDVLPSPVSIDDIRTSVEALCYPEGIFKAMVRQNKDKEGGSKAADGRLNHVLIVEHRKLQRKSWHNAFQNLGCMISEAVSGVDAVSIVRKSIAPSAMCICPLIDAVVLDISIRSYVDELRCLGFKGLIFCVVSSGSGSTTVSIDKRKPIAEELMSKWGMDWAVEEPLSAVRLQAAIRGAQERRKRRLMPTLNISKMLEDKKCANEENENEMVEQKCGIERRVVWSPRNVEAGADTKPYDAKYTRTQVAAKGRETGDKAAGNCATCDSTAKHVHPVHCKCWRETHSKHDNKHSKHDDKHTGQELEQEVVNSHNDDIDLKAEGSNTEKHHNSASLSVDIKCDVVNDADTWTEDNEDEGWETNRDQMASHSSLWMTAFARPLRSQSCSLTPSSPSTPSPPSSSPSTGDCASPYTLHQRPNSSSGHSHSLSPSRPLRLPATRALAEKPSGGNFQGAIPRIAPTSTARLLSGRGLGSLRSLSSSSFSSTSSSSTTLLSSVSVTKTPSLEEIASNPLSWRSLKDRSKASSPSPPLVDYAIPSEAMVRVAFPRYKSKKNDSAQEPITKFASSGRDIKEIDEIAQLFKMIEDRALVANSGRNHELDRSKEGVREQIQSSREVLRKVHEDAVCMHTKMMGLQNGADKQGSRLNTNQLVVSGPKADGNSILPPSPEGRRQPTSSCFLQPSDGSGMYSAPKRLFIQRS